MLIWLFTSESLVSGHTHGCVQKREDVQKIDFLCFSEQPKKIPLYRQHPEYFLHGLSCRECTKRERAHAAAADSWTSRRWQ